MNLKEVAERAGVSTATVSNVVNGNFHKVSEETRQRVEKIVRETGYKPNVMARSLANKESRIIGVVVPYIGTEEGFLSNPYNAYVISTLEQQVRSRDYYLMLRCVGNPREIIPLLSSWNVEGAVFLGIAEKDLKEIRNLLHVPMVFLDTYSGEEPIANVGIDDYRGGYLSARYLISRGHRRIALAIPKSEGTGVISERFRGFSTACRELGAHLTEEDIYHTNTLHRDAMGIGQDIAFSDRGYTAVAAMSDLVAFGLIEGLRQCGVRVPDDISVIGFDNLPQCEYMSPKLTTVSQDARQKAVRATELLFEMLTTGEEIIADERLAISIAERHSVRTLAE